MSNIQETLDSLQPYVIGIRYLEGTALVDVIFKEGWSIPEDKTLKIIKGDNEVNYYMIFSETKGVGLDNLLAYVKRTININQDREKKLELLRTKIVELKEIFKRNSLTKLSNLKFSFGEIETEPTLNEIDIEQPVIILPKVEVVEQPYIEEPYEEEPVQSQPVSQPTKPQQNVNYGTPLEPKVFLDENGHPIELSEDDKEMLEEEARAERNRKLLAHTKPAGPKPRVELPPKRKAQVAMAERDYETDCECGPNEACDKCIDKKDL